MLALYCNPDSTGRIVLLRDLHEEIARIECTQAGGSQLAWCGNECMVLSVAD